ncbi:MAG: insulinase family protein, partial [Candidatus Hydrogenedentes bacterium]|nr:insulinase family protein [Candidatus Hydrogenedentota bacterium]
AAAGRTNDCIDLIADWMARPEITAEDFAREHEVVQRELEMGKDDPRRIQYYAHQANLYGTHPAAVPVIGFADPLARLTYEDVRTYHRRMYVPQNIIFVVVGDIDPQAAIARVVQQMQGFHKGRSPEFTLPESPPVSGIRRVVRHSAAFKEAAQLMSFRTIPLVHPDLYALDVLSHVLSRGRSSRLVRELKFNKRLVTSIDSWSNTPSWGRGAFTVTFRADPAKTDAAEKAILEELRRVIREGVTTDELDRAKRQKIAEYLRSQQTMESIASTIATDFAATGDLGFSQNYTDNIQKVTAEKVRAMAEKYFHFDAMVITRMLPATGPEVAEKKTTPQARRRTEIYTLPNGLKVVLKPTETVGLVSMVMAVQGGLLMEERKTNGLGSLMVDLSTRG